jgi:hypothetical protein
MLSSLDGGNGFASVRLKKDHFAIDNLASEI